MEQSTTYTHRTREEILAWWRRARERKEQFQKETDEWWRARQKGLKEAEESGYYNFDGVSNEES